MWLFFTPDGRAFSYATIAGGLGTRLVRKERCTSIDNKTIATSAQIRLSERRSLLTRQTQVLLNSSRDHESNEIPTYVASSGFEWKEHQLRVSPGAPGQRKDKVRAAGGDLHEFVPGTIRTRYHWKTGEKGASGRGGSSQIIPGYHWEWKNKVRAAGGFSPAAPQSRARKESGPPGGIKRCSVSRAVLD